LELTPANNGAVTLPQKNMNYNTEQNKAIVRRFNKECIEEGKQESLKELLSENVINHSAVPGMPDGAESFYYFLNEVLRKGFSNIKVNIHQQIAEGDLVTSRKTISGLHSGEIFGIAPSHKTVSINVIDIIRLENGQYAEHWGQSNFGEVLGQLEGHK
jgi:predicted ester cyclase